ncbi:hypothetical protein VK70_14180 [Paenibacillus durus ATCC 35681]|uniref:NADP-dependent oxidoreductase domain-containing protein n=1 Tax=Paenibacillus durus ATCC 35681 TaxID=1333534 RepID=A0A0F7FAA2_PAEDU|nr:hypothetical protein VK70_14180 [Paenibacillus durus ATCC 35681]
MQRLKEAGKIRAIGVSNFNIDQLRVIAKSKDTEIANLVLAWYLTRDEIDSLNPGAKKPAQILANLTTLDVKLNADEIAKIDSIFRDCFKAFQPLSS